jgi:hypothetical protein
VLGFVILHYFVEDASEVPLCFADCPVPSNEPVKVARIYSRAVLAHVEIAVIGVAVATGKPRKHMCLCYRREHAPLLAAGVWLSGHSAAC